MSADRSHFSLVHLDGFIYAIGGHSSDYDASVTVERFNLANQTWDHNYTLPEPLAETTAVVYSGKLLVYGLKLVDVPEDEVNMFTYILLCFDPVRQEWSKLLEESRPVATIATKMDSSDTGILIVQNGSCYRVWFARSNETDEEILCFPHVNRIAVRTLRSGAMRANIGEEIENQTPGQNNIVNNNGYAFHIDGEVYVLVMPDFVYKTGLTVKEDSEVDVDGFMKSVPTLGYSSVVEFTLDLRCITGP